MTANNPSTRRFFIAALATACLLTFAPAASAATTGQTIRAGLTNSGLYVTNLSVTDVDGIVIIRGRVSDAETFRAVTRYVRSLGHTRVANLLRVTPFPDDRVIERAAERQLGLSRSLEGCKLVVNSDSGVVILQGTVQNDLQRDVAIDIVRKIEGVRDVQVLVSSS